MIYKLKCLLRGNPLIQWVGSDKVRALFGYRERFIPYSEVIDKNLDKNYLDKDYNETTR